MKKRFFIQAGLTTMLFFLFLNLFGSPFVSTSSLQAVDYDHDWKATPNGKFAIKGTYRALVQTSNTSFEWMIFSCFPGELNIALKNNSILNLKYILYELLVNYPVLFHGNMAK